MDNEELFEQWAVVELLGHVRMAGLVTEEDRFGGKLGRIDIPVGDKFITQYFGHGSVYRLTPCSEEVARAVSSANEPRPVHVYELPAQAMRGEDLGDSVYEEFERVVDGPRP